MTVLHKDFTRILANQQSLLANIDHEFIAKKREEFRNLYLAGLAERLFTTEAEACYIMDYGAFGWRSVLFTADGRMKTGKFAATRDLSVANLIAR